MDPNAFSSPDDLLVKFLAGEATSEEQAEVTQWIEAKAENQAYFKDLKAIWTEAEEVQEAEVKEIDAGWVAFKQRTSTPPNLLPFYRRPEFLLAIAASIIFILAGIWLFTKQPKGPNPTFYAYVATDSLLQVNLPDGSEVFLSPGSKLNTYLPFAQAERRLELEGKAFFDVARDTLRNFIIEAGGLEVKVLGTSFEVNEREEGLSVSVKTGKVAVRNVGQDSIALSAGQRASKLTPLAWQPVLDTLPSNALSWKTKELSFQNINLEAAIRDVEAAYDVIIKFDPNAIASCLVNTSFRNEDLEYVLEILTSFNNLSWSKEGDIYQIQGKGC